MARKTIGYVELEWTCPRCHNRNPGTNQFCNGCGGPMPEDVEFEQPLEEKLLKDTEKIARAKAGPDRHCPYCEARNRGDVKFCGGCGGDLSDAAIRKAGHVLGAHRHDIAYPGLAVFRDRSQPRQLGPDDDFENPFLEVGHVIAPV